MAGLTVVWIAYIAGTVFEDLGLARVRATTDREPVPQVPEVQPVWARLEPSRKVLLAPLLVLALGHMDGVLVVSRHRGHDAVEKPGVGVWVVRVDGFLATAVHADLRRHLSSAFRIENRERQLALIAWKIEGRPVRNGCVRTLVVFAGGPRRHEKGDNGETYQHAACYAPRYESTPGLSSTAGLWGFRQFHRPFPSPCIPAAMCSPTSLAIITAR
jgi:hypothetical protein